MTGTLEKSVSKLKLNGYLMIENHFLNLGRNRCVCIAEVAQAHDGSLGTAHAFIDAIAKAGADAVKFQTHIASAESTRDEPWRIKFSLQDENRYDYWKRMEFTEDQWNGLKLHAEDRSLMFLSSPFSVEAADLLSRVGVAAWKIASGEVGNVKLFERLVETKLPILLSTGMSTLDEIDVAVQTIKAKNIVLTILQCTSMYPCPPEKVGLNLIPQFREKYNCAVGLSDHSGTIFAGLAAAGIGIDVLEVHVTLSREMFGPDVNSSITTTELKQLVDGLHFIETMNINPVDKDSMAKDLTAMRDLFAKSVVARVNLPAGTIILQEQLAVKKPGTGVRPDRMFDLIGHRLNRDVAADEQIHLDDVE